jgi:hypothetical protein
MVPTRPHPTWWKSLDWCQLADDTPPPHKPLRGAFWGWGGGGGMTVRCKKDGCILYIVPTRYTKVFYLLLLLCFNIIKSFFSVVDPNWLHYESRSSFLLQCGSKSREPNQCWSGSGSWSDFAVSKSWFFTWKYSVTLIFISIPRILGIRK